MQNISLVGNQNCGKTAVFNCLTGSRMHVGNYPGVTVERKTGFLRGSDDILITDLPGVYSLVPFTSEEAVTRDFLMNSRPDAVINVLDATNLERNLYLSLQLSELNIPTVVALNFSDILRENGVSADTDALSSALGCEVIAVSAASGEGIGCLSNALRAEIKKPAAVRYPPETEKCLARIGEMIRKSRNGTAPLRFAAETLLCGDENRTGFLTDSERDVHMTRLIEYRYSRASEIASRTLETKSGGNKGRRSRKADLLLTGRITAIPAFLALFGIAFSLTFGFFGRFLSELVSLGVSEISRLLYGWMVNAGVSEWLCLLTKQGIMGGVGSVLSFLPVIMMLFFFLSMLEDSGYMARAAFITDRLLSWAGLSGKAFAPLMIGFGCSVPAYMAMRALPSRRERFLTSMLVPFMSCGAKLPVYSLVAYTVVPENAFAVICGIYVLSAVCGAASSVLLSRILKGEKAEFLIELPPYRLPSPKSVFLHMCDRAKGFASKAFSVILVASVAVWVLQSFDFSLASVMPEESMLASFSKLLLPALRLAGICDWRLVAALITGVFAKESVVSTLSVLCAGVGGIAALFPNFASAAPFLVFVMLYTPCVASLATLAREEGRKTAFLSAVYQLALAYLCASVVNASA